ncbi:cadherin EGF LAG seven-pass G-type receptor 1-like [Ptychodera flava]|uniref:cadherin EGF LAG seven-pass G-type receptor 1-like n=1 Tax=Ptychodera flava TaxID=63121 RepID=UPI00396A65B2
MLTCLEKILNASTGDESTGSSCIDLVAKTPCVFNIIASGVVTHLTVQHGVTVDITCPKGMRLDNAASFTCIDGANESYSCIDNNECENGLHNCDLERICNNTPGSYQCLCQDGFIDINGLCVPKRTIQVDDKKQRGHEIGVRHCPANGNDTWQATEVNHYSPWIPCPHGSVGVMRRFCNADGEWEKPDTTECRTRELVEVFGQITNITGVSDAVAVLDSLTNISKSDSSAYGGDMLLLSDMLLNIATKISHSEGSSVEDMQEYAQVFMEHEGQLLSPGYEDLWMQVYQEHGPNDGVIKVFAALEQLSNTVYEMMRGSRQHVTLSKGKIALQGVFVNPTKEYIVDTAGISISTKRRLLQENNADVPESYLKVSQETLEKINSSRSTGMPLAVISYVYRNPGDILPSDAVTTRPKERQWVKSITAVTRIKKVNTPVISVSVYPKLQGDVDIDVHMRMYTKEDGYSPKCSSMEVDAKYGIWTTNSCSLTVRGTHDIWQYVECTCSRFGNFAVIMTIGKEPKPFVEAAAKVVLTISCALSLLFIVISITAVCMARLTSDFYLVLGQLILSFGIFPILVAIDVNFAAGENKESCQLMAAFSHYALLSNCVWMMNLSIQFFKRLKHYVYKSTSTRLVYAFCGWVIPCVVFINWKEQFPVDDKQQREVGELGKK